MSNTSPVNLKKNLLLGVGSQRAGSTLLYRLLHTSMKGLFMHPVKELHVFDSIHNVRPPKALKTFSEHQLERLNKSHGELDEVKNGGNKRLICEIRANKILSERDINKVDYLDLFRPCLMHYNWIGEITPEYMLLSKEQLKDIYRLFDGRVVPILMVRNPAKRFVSAFKLRHAYMRPKDQPAPDNYILLKDLNLLLNRHKEDGWVKAQLRLTSVFGRNCLILSLDTLVSRPKDAFKVLEDCTGLDLDYDRAISCLREKVNETDINLCIDEPTSKLLNNFFAESIRDAEDLCGHTLKI